MNMVVHTGTRQTNVGAGVGVDASGGVLWLYRARAVAPVGPGFTCGGFISSCPMGRVFNMSLILE